MTGPGVPVLLMDRSPWTRTRPGPELDRPVDIDIAWFPLPLAKFRHQGLMRRLFIIFVFLG